MNRIAFFCLTFFMIGFDICGASLNGNATSSKKNAKKILDQPYGKDPQQRMDIYLPKNRNERTKVFILLHGGGWSSGDKSDLNSMVDFLKTRFPDHAVVNVNYRLATAEKLGYPRQVDDIKRIISYLDSKSVEHNVSQNYAMIGTSAGGHLAMLYSYKYNTSKKVKSVCSIVAPTDFSDPRYKGHIIFNYGLNFFAGNYRSYEENPKLYNKISPAKHVSSSAPATLLIYSADDPLVPITQGEILHNKLKTKAVYSEYHKYDNADHAKWSPEQQSDIDEKIKKFFTQHF